MENHITPSPLQSNVSLVSTSGSTSALTIAFNDLKRRYLLRQSELANLKLHSQKMNSQLQQSLNTTHIFERKIDQLQKSLQSKITAYNNLEATYKQTREHEDSLIVHSNETERMLEDSLKKLKHYKDENDTLRKEQRKLQQNLSLSMEQKEQLELELHEIKQIPEVKVSKHEILLPKGGAGKYIFDNDTNFWQQHELQAKRIHDLVAENQRLRTNVHWLCEELKAAREKKPTKRIRRDSDSLEEGKKVTNKETGTKTINKTCTAGTKSTEHMASYIEKLNKTVHTLRTALKLNTKALDDLVLDRLENNSLPQSKIHTCLPNKLHDIESNEKYCDNNEQFQPRTQIEAVNSHIANIDIAENIPIFEKLEKHKRLYPSMWKSHEQNVPDNDPLKQVKLPPSLLHSVKLQQTQTYLTSKTFLQQVPQICQKIPPIYNNCESLQPIEASCTNGALGSCMYNENSSQTHDSVPGNIHLNKVSLGDENEIVSDENNHLISL